LCLQWACNVRTHRGAALSGGSALRRNATFPQELAFSLDQPARLTQLQVLSHEYKVMLRLQADACSCNSISNFACHTEVASRHVTAHRHDARHVQAECLLAFGTQTLCFRLCRQIASRVEVFVSPPGAPLGAEGTAAWRRLGFLSLDPNEQSGHQVGNAQRLQMLRLQSSVSQMQLKRPTECQRIANSYCY
jgi:hypothetical protein